MVQVPIRLYDAQERASQHGGRRGVAYPEHVSGAKHVVHIGGMVLIFAGYFVWQMLYGNGQFLVHALQGEAQSLPSVAGPDGRF